MGVVVDVVDVLDCMQQRIHICIPGLLLSAWVIFSARIACGTERVGELCRRLVVFLTCGTFERYLPDGDAGLEHNDQDICILMQLTQKNFTTTNH